MRNPNWLIKNEKRPRKFENFAKTIFIKDGTGDYYPLKLREISIIGLLKTECGFYNPSKGNSDFERSAKHFFHGKHHELFVKAQIKVYNEMNEKMVIKSAFISSRYGLIDFSEKIRYYKPSITKLKVDELQKLSEKVKFAEKFLAWSKNCDILFFLLSRQYLKFCNFRNMPNFPTSPQCVFVGPRENKGLVPRLSNVFFIRSGELLETTGEKKAFQMERTLLSLIDDLGSEKWKAQLSRLRVKSKPFFDNPDNYLNDLSGKDWLRLSKSIWRVSSSEEVVQRAMKIFRRDSQPYVILTSKNGVISTNRIPYIHISNFNTLKSNQLRDINESISSKGYLTIKTQLSPDESGSLLHEKVIHEMQRIGLHYQDLIVFDENWEKYHTKDSIEEVPLFLRDMTITKKEKTDHSAQFSEKLTRYLIKRFSTNDSSVLDPFVGSGTVVKCATILGRKSVGIDIEPSFLKIAKERLQKELPKEQYALLNTDSRYLSSSTELLDWFQNVKCSGFDLIISSPPYWDVLNRRRVKTVLGKRSKNNSQYSDLSSDLGNFENYNEFLHNLSLVLNECWNVTKPGGIACWIVMDIRKKNKVFPFHIDIINKATKIGWKLKEILIWDRNSDYNYLRPMGYPTTFIVNHIHEFVLIFKKSKELDSNSLNDFRNPLKCLLIFRKGK